MSELKELLIDNLKDLLSAENQIVGALPKMIEAADNNKLEEALEKHLTQTEGHVQRLQQALETLGGDTDSEPCRGMKGILEEGEEAIEKGEDKDEMIADLGLIAAAQKVEHYEITAYGTAKCLAKQLGEVEVAKLLSRTLGEEEAADFILTSLGKPLLEQVTSQEFGNGTKMPWGEPGRPTDPSSLVGENGGSSRAFAATAGQSRAGTQSQSHVAGASQSASASEQPRPNAAKTTFAGKASFAKSNKGKR